MPSENQILTANWVLRLPGDWAAVDDQVQGFQFESADNSKGLFIATHSIGAAHPSSVEDLAAWFLAADAATLADMRDYAWKSLQRTVQAADGCCMALHDSLAPAQDYRVIAKILARPGQVVRASFHDYDCRDYAASQAYFAPILGSLQFVDPRAAPAGVRLH
ncbi:MAG: hypothetical protein V4484_06815 [Pseudomonadota bacterium]